MVRLCAFPTCGNKMSRSSARSFHRLPLRDAGTRRLWLEALEMDAHTPVEALRTADHRVCSDHFASDDYSEPKRKRKAPPKHVFIRRTAVPRAGRPAARTAEVMLLMAEVWTWTQSHHTQEQGRRSVNMLFRQVVEML
ncbi:peroxynitrite isomerase THAP4-like [Platichthys flesus]|uniref:peroxynitrite isomerase THAP4-like n=1 Tax=Platichthys flesus TaxID=8260 RepID=UPI002DB8B216|nr:peroxynitrite isomerase THAP4-like [Platichthys flesus]